MIYKGLSPEGIEAIERPPDVEHGHAGQRRRHVDALQPPGRPVHTRCDNPVAEIDRVEPPDTVHLVLQPFDVHVHVLLGHSLFLMTFAVGSETGLLSFQQKQIGVRFVAGALGEGRLVGGGRQLESGVLCRRARRATPAWWAARYMNDLTSDAPWLRTVGCPAR